MLPDLQCSQSVAALSAPQRLLLSITQVLPPLCRPPTQGEDRHGRWGRGRLLRLSADVLERAASGGSVEVEVGAAEGEESGKVALEVEGEAVEVETVTQVGRREHVAFSVIK